MSAYGDWKAGIITEDQYRAACLLEECQGDETEDGDRSDND